MPDRNKKDAGFDFGNLDTSVRPQDDFYRFSNGTWIDNNPIPSDRPRWGTFMELHERNLERLHGILSDIAEDEEVPTGSNEQKLRDFWNEFMDTDKRNRLGTQPIQKELDDIDQIANLDDAQGVIAHLGRLGIGTFWGFEVDVDDKAPTNNIIFLKQGGMGLPTRDYYFDEQFEEVRTKYLNYVQEILQLLGYSKRRARSAALAVMRIEEQLAQHAMRPQEMRDVDNVYNKLGREQLAELASGIDWARYFDAMNASGEEEFIVKQPEFFRNLNTLLCSTSIKELKQYLLFRMVSAFANQLSDDFDNARFNFYSKVLSGTEEMPPLWKRGVELVTSDLDHAISPLYTARYFDEGAKQVMGHLVANLKHVFRERIRKLSWMSGATKQRAIEKLENFDVMVGYPDERHSMEALSIGRNSHLENFLNVSRFNVDYMLGKLGNPVDRREWAMPAPTVNAYIRHELNHLVFPAGILQPPFFNPEADDAFNYGGIGAVIGHEMSHGFDDRGRKYDASGRLNDWWEAQDAEEFNALARLIVEQFSGYTILGDLHVNGELTQGENIGDLGGLCIALDAYMDTLSESERKKKINGFTPVQRFFLGWAQIWRSNIKEELARQFINRDPHSPNVWRTNGPFTNMDAFHEAFGTKPGDELYKEPEERIVIW